MQDKDIKKTVRNIAERYGIEKESAESHTAYLNRVILRLADEITHYQNQNAELYTKINAAVHESDEYKQLVSECQRLQETSNMWKDLYEQAEKKLEKQTSQDPQNSPFNSETQAESTNQTYVERKTERYTIIPDPPRRGPKRKADDTTRQYIHELRKYGNSLQAIADKTGISKTQVHTILKEPEIQGKWYSDQGGERIYYDSYMQALDSGQDIFYQKITDEIANN